ncbi:MAG: rane-associated protein [Actinomycetota bacterium]|jgi:membrane-associated protein
MSTLLSPNHLIEAFGTIGVIAVIFAESGLLIGFFLPGDSLLFTAGLLSSQGKLNFGVLLLGCCVAAVIGGQVGYLIGARVGPTLFRRPDSRLFKHEYVEQAEGYFDRYGSRTIVLARFVPIVRTFAPVVAGISKMRLRVFTTYNVIGSIVWGAGVLTLGHVLGDTIPNIDKYLLPIILLIIAVSAIPVVLEVLRARRTARG